MKFYLAREGVAFGPYTEFQVRESIRLGIFERGDLALAENGKEWSTVAQLLPTAENASSGAEEPKSAPELAPLSATETLAVPVADLRPARRLAWAAPVILAACVAGGWVFFRTRDAAPPPAPAQTTVAKAPAEAARPESSLRPTEDNMTLPTRENMAGAPSQASTVANPQLPPADPAQKADQAEDPSPDSGSPQHIVEGQINIAARNGKTYEPAAVEVRLYPIALLRPFLEKRGLEANAKYDELGEKIKVAEAEKEKLRKVYDEAFNAYTTSGREALNRRELEEASAEAKKAREKASNDYYNLRQEREDILSGAFYLQDLPPAASVARTDAQGRFRLVAPDDGEFAVVAGTQRQGEQVERYYWFLPVSLSQPVLLSNNNTTAHGSTESLVQTID